MRTLRQAVSEPAELLRVNSMKQSVLLIFAPYIKQVFHKTDCRGITCLAETLLVLIHS